MQRPVPQLPTATKESSLQAVAVVLVAVAVAVSIQVLVVVAVAVAVSIQAVALVVATVALVVSIEANPSLAIPQQQIGSAAESGNAACCLKYYLDHR